MPPVVLSNLAKLRTIADAHSLDQEEIAALTEYSIDSVRGWFCRTGSERYRPVPDRAMSLLRANLKDKKGVSI